VLEVVKILRLVDGDAESEMGYMYIYEAMLGAKEKIKKNSTISRVV